MAYRSYLKVYGASAQATIMADISTWMQAMGWTLYDNISAASHVLTSAGEDGLKNPEFVHLWVSGNNVYHDTYVYWDLGTHTGAGQGNTYSSNRYFAANAANTMRCYGDKDFVWVVYGTNVNGHGHIQNPTTTLPNTSITGAISSGANVVATVASTDGFQIGGKAQLVDYTTGCRETVSINDINPGVSVTIATLLNNYSNGSKFGYAPSVFGAIGHNASFLFLTCPSAASGTGAASTSYVSGYVAASVIATPLEPDPKNTLYSLMPFVYRAAGEASVLGSVTSNSLYAENAVGDIFMVCTAGNRYEVGTATAGGAAVMDDAGKAWGVNRLIGKILVLTTGTGAGQTRYIISNTATRIVVGQNWVTNPIAGTGYTICDEAYYLISSNLALKEVIGQP